MRKTHEVFPLAVHQTEIKCHSEFKEKHFESLKQYWFNGYEYESPEASSRIFVHLKEEYSDFFISLKEALNEYLEVLEIENDDLEDETTISSKITLLINNSLK